MLQLQEEVISARVAKEFTEENLNATIAMLQKQLLQEETQRRRLDEELRKENRELRWVGKERHRVDMKAFICYMKQAKSWPWHTTSSYY